MILSPGPYLAFDAVAQDYDRTRVIPPLILEDIARLCASQARLKFGGLFLDAGVGTGRLAAPLSRMHPGRIVGVDASAPMMSQARGKTAPGSVALVQADLQRLPFRPGTFRGALVVHVLQLIQHWRLALNELRRVLLPRLGVLFLGSEQGGRSRIVDYYYQRARAMSVLRPSLGAAGLAPAVGWLRGTDGGNAQVEKVSAPFLAWERRVSVGETLDALERRTYSQTWDIPDAAHRSLLTDTKDYARRAVGDDDAEECLDTRFVLYAVRWP